MCVELCPVHKKTSLILIRDSMLLVHRSLFCNSKKNRYMLQCLKCSFKLGCINWVRASQNRLCNGFSGCVCHMQQVLWCTYSENLLVVSLYHSLANCLECLGSIRFPLIATVSIDQVNLPHENMKVDVKDKRNIL